MVITGVAQLTGALSRELNNVPWRQSNYMHVLVTTTANQAENDDASRQSFHHLRGKQGSCSASRSRRPDPGRHRASASPPPALCTTDFLSRRTRSSSDPDDPSRTSSCPHCNPTATPPVPTSHISTLCVCISRIARREIQDKIPLFHHVVSVMMGEKLLSV